MRAGIYTRVDREMYKTDAVAAAPTVSSDRLILSVLRVSHPTSQTTQYAADEGTQNAKDTERENRRAEGYSTR